jgi:polysaccharide biosynthesis/export protein
MKFWTQLKSNVLIINSNYLTLLLILVLSACSNVKQITYFNDLPAGEKIGLPTITPKTQVIMAQDILYINVGGTSITGTLELINKNAEPAMQYVVDMQGEISFYKLGKVKAAGLTVQELEKQLTDALEKEKLVRDLKVSVRILSFRFTVLGEVKSPGTYSLAKEQVTILEAIGLAGDMTGAGKRANVRVIRDSVGKREIGTVNFNQKTVFSSEYYFLQRNDVIYVEPQKNKLRQEEFAKNFALVATVLSFFVALVGVSIQLNR